MDISRAEGSNSILISFHRYCWDVCSRIPYRRHASPRQGATHPLRHHTSIAFYRASSFSSEYCQSYRRLLGLSFTCTISTHRLRLHLRIPTDASNSASPSFGFVSSFAFCLHCTLPHIDIWPPVRKTDARDRAPMPLTHYWATAPLADVLHHPPHAHPTPRPASDLLAVNPPNAHYP